MRVLASDGEVDLGDVNRRRDQTITDAAHHDGVWRRAGPKPNDETRSACLHGDLVLPASLKAGHTERVESTCPVASISFGDNFGTAFFSSS